MMVESVVLSSCALYFILFPILPHVVCGLQFNSLFNGRKLTGVLGSSVNFTWAFQGGDIDRVIWGTKHDGALSIKDFLVSVYKFQIIIFTETPSYRGRVSGEWDGGNPGQATFYLFI